MDIESKIVLFGTVLSSIYGFVLVYFVSLLRLYQVEDTK